MEDKLSGGVDDGEGHCKAKFIDLTHDGPVREGREV